jgi:hypothetical protein
MSWTGIQAAARAPAMLLTEGVLLLQGDLCGGGGGGGGAERCEGAAASALLHVQGVGRRGPERHPVQ